MSRHRRQRRGARSAPALLLGLIAASLASLVVGVVLVVTGPASPSAAAASPNTTSVPVPAGSAAPALAPAAPSALDIPTIGAHSSLIPTGLGADRRIVVPSVHTPEQAAWYTGAPIPGTPGPAIVVGHVNGGGRDGVFADLADVTPGDAVRITRTDHTVAIFTVTRVQTAEKNAFPTRAVYGDTPGPELRLITCGGVFDQAAHSYESNVIVYATLTGTERT